MDKINKFMLKLKLQLFAGEPNTNVTTDTGMTPDIKNYYDTTLIRGAKKKLVHGQFGQSKPIPKGNGKTMIFTKKGSLPVNVTPLNEGITPDGKKLSFTSFNATVSQYGDYVTLSDLLTLTTMDPAIVEAVDSIADQAGRTLDYLDREALNAGTNVMYAASRTTRATIAAGDKITSQLIDRAATFLSANYADTLEGGYYVGIIHPYVSYDIRRDQNWIDVAKYSAPEMIFNREIGRIAGVRFTETPEAKIFTGAGAESIDVYSTIILGKDAYGITELEGGGLETIVKQLGSGNDPLNQRATVGWKATRVLKIINDAYMTRIESATSF